MVEASRGGCGAAFGYWLLPIVCTIISSAEGYASGLDPNTVALWLFDEPPYRNMTLTDASENHYDLRLYTAGRLGKGRFGGAAGRSDGISGQAVSFAETPQEFPNDWRGTLKSRPATPPEKLLATLQGGDWTWEFHVKMDASPTEDACLIDAGDRFFSCVLTRSARAIVVRSALAQFDLAVPIKANLADGSWHHVAFTWSAGSRKLACFIDGVACGVPTPIAADTGTIKIAPPSGLRGRIFGNTDLTRPAGEEITPCFNDDWDVSRGTGWSERWTGSLASHVTGEVTFRAEASGGVRLKIGEKTVIDGWAKNGARTGKISLLEGKRYPLLLEYFHAGERARLRLFWNWPSHPEEAVPESAFSHNSDGPLAYRFDLALLSDQNGARPCSAWLDEMRVSRTLRYSKDFTPPGAFSRNHGASPPAAAMPGELPLLFGDNGPTIPVRLGSRKHVFIDDAILAERERVEIRQSPVRKVERAEFASDAGDATALEWDGTVRLYYGGWNGNNRLAISRDGLKFEHSNYGISEWGGQRGLGGDSLFRLPGQASFFVDGNPNTPADERFKAVAWTMTRGIHALTSPDGIRWRRNETLMLPFDCGGGVEAYWDDQQGLYVCHIRHEGYYAHGLDIQRIAARAESRNFLTTWPFDPDPNPIPRRAFTLPALWKELPMPFVPDQGGQVYRTRAIKYPWAPDVYLAFVWRYDVPRDLRQTELAVSRDGRNWRFFGLKPPYIPARGKFDGAHVAKAALPTYGLVRRGDEIWQYVTFDTRGHNSTEGYRSLQRLAQRLDGFVALEAGPEGGSIQTKPLVFAGKRLELNVAARGRLRVGVLDGQGKPIPGFAVDDCQPIGEDGVRVAVRWNGGHELSSLAGRPVCLRFEMTDASLYAMQFVP